MADAQPDPTPDDPTDAPLEPARSLSDLGPDPTKEDLYALAQERGIEGRSSMDAGELARAIRQAENVNPEPGDAIRVTRSAGVPWPAMGVDIPVQAGQVFRVTPDPPEGHKTERFAPLGLGSNSVRESAARALCDGGDAIVVSRAD